VKRPDGGGRRAAGAAGRPELSGRGVGSTPLGSSAAATRAPHAITVRQASRDDLPTVVALRLSLLREHGTHAIYGRLRADAAHRARELFAAQLESAGEVMFLAERAGQVVGILRCVESSGSPLLHPARYGYVSSVFVTPAARRAGVLRALLEQAVRWCGERGLDEMRLHSVAGDAVSEAAWDALGFEIVEYVRLRKVRL
jgi:GNAT superfamily N-acetyltransferase